MLTRPQHNALRVAADRARLAPSVHNTQPWRLELHADRLELRLDHARQLPVLDPAGRELVMSVGAALLNARVGMASVQHGATVSRFPDPPQPDLAGVLVPTAGPPEDRLAALDPLLTLRRSNREPFSGSAPAEVAEQLGAVAAAEGAALVLLDGPRRTHLARLAAVARDVQEADPGYLHELDVWTSRPADQHDGVPARSTPGRRQLPGVVPLRDFGAPRAAGPREEPGEETLLVLTSPGDSPLSWLRTGEALERVLLEVVRLGWQAGLVTQPLEVPATRAAVADLLPPGHVPQVVLRVGRAEPPMDRTPRRATADVLTDLTAFPRRAGQEIAPPEGLARDR